MALDPNDWAYCFDYTIDHDLIDSTLSGFPVPIKLSGSCGIGSFDATHIFDVLGANSKKIAITDSSYNQLYVEIDLWDDAGEEAYLHAKHSSVSNSADTVLKIFYDSTKDDNTTYVGDTGDEAAEENVWDSAFKGVWHKSQDPSGGAGCMLDSTSNDNDGTPSGCTDAGDLVTGKFGKAIEYDGTDDYINCGSGASLDDISVITVEALIYLDSFGEANGGRIAQKANVNEDGWQFLVQGGTGANRLYFGRDWNGGTFAHWWTAADTLTTGTWYHVAVVYNKGATTNDPLLYINGVSMAVTENVSPVGTCDSDASNDLWIGARSNSGADREFDGKICEVRVSDGQRATAWLKATYHGLFDTLATVTVADRNISADPIEITFSVLGNIIESVLVVADPIALTLLPVSGGFVVGVIVSSNPIGLTLLPVSDGFVEGQIWDDGLIDLTLTIRSSAAIFIGESVYKQDPWVLNTLHYGKDNPVGIWGFTKQPDKLCYNEGDEIECSDSPVFDIDFTKNPITSIHKPCGYWHSTPTNFIPGDPPSIYSEKCDDSSMAWDSDTAAATINRNGQALVAITDDGVSGSPYIWELDQQSIDAGFSLSNRRTLGLTNVLHADGAACGTALIMVTGCDGLGTYVMGYVRCVEGSEWANNEVVCGQAWNGSIDSCIEVSADNHYQYTISCDCMPIELCPPCAEYSDYCVPTASACAAVGSGCSAGYCYPCNFGYPSGICVIAGQSMVQRKEWVCV